MLKEVLTASVRSFISPEVQMEAAKVSEFLVCGSFPLSLLREADGGGRATKPVVCSRAVLIFMSPPHIHNLNGFLWQLGIFMALFDSMGFSADGGWRCWWGGGCLQMEVEKRFGCETEQQPSSHWEISLFLFGVCYNYNKLFVILDCFCSYSGFSHGGGLYSGFCKIESRISA